MGKTNKRMVKKKEGGTIYQRLELNFEVGKIKKSYTLKPASTSSA